MDYGHRIGEFNILESSEDELSAMADLFSELGIPVSTFITTSVLVNFPKSFSLVKMISKDYHVHSHTHNTKIFDNEAEFSATVSVFEEYFGYKPFGYRAPQGVLYDGDIDKIKKYGLKFSSSVFPSFRLGKFNNSSMPITPFIYSNGIVELPLAVIPKIRYIISLSYLKILGFNANKLLYSLFGLPNIIVFDSHLCDYILNEESFKKIPAHLKAAYGLNKHSGMSIFKRFVNLLKSKGYKFITMSELYKYIITSCP